ncbi:MAG TPA: alpha/beta fold hydrolase [Terriglobales bacterium]|nr:alpha/beta fold hydrolase [Terriglobales bacterium]
MRSVHPHRESRGSPIRTRDHLAAEVPILSEVLFPLDLVLLHAAPLYYGVGVPHGDGSAVVLIPAFLCPDFYLAPLHEWLRRIGYKPVFSGIGLNTECPNLLITRQLNQTIDQALSKSKSGRKVHLIGHSLGGVIARAIAAQRPNDVASVITLGAPFRGTVAHAGILGVAEMVRKSILAKHGSAVLPACYTPRCTCDFLESLNCAMHPSVLQTAVYTEGDGVVDWRYCKTDIPETDFRVSGTHIGLAFNPLAYSVIANRLAQARVKKPQERRRRRT